jgi:hypothetical protein
MFSGEFTSPVQLFERKYYWPLKQVNGKYVYFARREGKRPLDVIDTKLGLIISDLDSKTAG